jgi:nucleoside 2-deoxyribosyltransferase
MHTVYCSGPLFSPEEKAGMAAMAVVLEGAGYHTFLPQRDGVERLVMGLVDTPFNVNILGARDIIERAVFSLDVFQIVERCDCLVMNMNGRVPDEGAAVEAGVAFAAGKPVVLYKNDRRSVLGGRDNAMLYGLSRLAPVNVLEKLPASVKKAVKLHSKPGGGEKPRLPENVLATLRHGERVWKIVSSIPGGKGKADEELVRRILEA